MLRFAWHAISSFSTIPLRVSLFAGVFIALFGLALVAYAIIAWLVGGTVTGWTSLMAVTCLIGAAILVSNAILGSYIGQISEEIKRRPLYVVSLFVETCDPEHVAAPERTAVPREERSIATHKTERDDRAPPPAGAGMKS